MSRPSRLRRLSGIGNGLLSERCKSGHERAAADVAILLTNAPAQKREKGYGTARRRTRALRSHRTPMAPGSPERWWRVQTNDPRPIGVHCTLQTIGGRSELREEQPDLAPGRLGRVRPVHEVLGELDREIAPDRHG